MDYQLRNSSLSGRVDEVSSLLKTHPDLDVNWADDISWTPLHWASRNGRHQVVKLLLAHPAINANIQTTSGQTPLLYCCMNGKVSVVPLLLNDPQIDVSLAERSGCTPLWYAAYNGHCEVIEWLIASGRDLGDLNKRGKWDLEGNEYSALEIARRRNRGEVASLLERFMGNAEQTRHEIRGKLGVLDGQAAECFALIVFLCDDLLQLKPALQATPSFNPIAAASAAAASRFFIIASKLPMELQMILCRRVVGSMKLSILQRDSEVAFKSLSAVLLWESSF